MADITSYFADQTGGQDDDIFAKIAQSSSNFDLQQQQSAAEGGADSGSSSHHLEQSMSSLMLENPAERLWIPSPETAQIISRVRKTPSCREEPDIAAGRTVPVVYAEKLGDPIREQLMLRNRSEALANRSFPTSTQVSKDLAGLKQLIAARCFRAALNLTSELLAGSMAPAPGSTSHMSWLTAQEHSIWSTRFSLQIRLNMAGVAEIEMQAFNSFDNPDLYQEFFPEAPTPGSNLSQLVPESYTSLVPFSTRLLHAQLPQFLQRNAEALDRLSSLLRSVERILSKIDPKSDFASVWRRRREDVLLAVANVMISLKSYRESRDVFEKILNSSKSIQTNSQNDSDRLCRVAALAGRAFLQSGCLPYAEIYFKKAESLSSKMSDFLNSLHQGYLAMAAGQFHEATSHFETAFTKSPDPALRVQSVTCVAVSIMYSGRLQEAIDRLESALFAEPAIFSTESLLINLSTMYELHQSNTADLRKLKLLDLVAQHCGDGFEIACLKLSPVAAPPADHTSSLPPPPPVVPTPVPAQQQAPPMASLPGPLQPPSTAPPTSFKPR